MAAAAIATGFVAIRMLIPNKVQVHQNNEILASNEITSISDHSDEVLKEELDLNFLIPEEGFDQGIEWTQEQLDSIKAINFAVFNHIEIKRKLSDKWDKQELKWLLNQDKNIFFNMIINRIQATSVQIQLKENLDLNFLIPEGGLDQDVEWTQEELDSIKATNSAVFKHIEIKRKLGDKWDKQELEWLLNQDKRVFLKVLLSGVKQLHTTLNNN